PSRLIPPADASAPYVTNTLHTHNPVKTIPEDALSQAVCPAMHGLKPPTYMDLLTLPSLNSLMEGYQVKLSGATKLLVGTSFDNKAELC
ncbi:MAG: hypothetical protein ABI167_13165, partial [Nitrosospira sp.]